MKPRLRKWKCRDWRRKCEIKEMLAHLNISKMSSVRKFIIKFQRDCITFKAKTNDRRNMATKPNHQTVQLQPYSRCNLSGLFKKTFIKIVRSLKKRNEENAKHFKQLLLMSSVVNWWMKTIHREREKEKLSVSNVRWERITGFFLNMKNLRHI